MLDIIDKIKLKIIILCHILIVLFVILSPFTNSNYILFMHSIIIPFIMLHWYFNNDMCALTLLEKKIREKMNGKENASDDCFTCKIIDPVYNFKNNNEGKTKFIYSGMIILWFISLFKIFKKYKTGKIHNFNDLFIL